MTRFLFLIVLFTGYILPSFAAHLKGGWIQYEYLGPGAAPNSSKYRVTVHQYLNCNSTPTQVDQQIYLGIFNADTVSATPAQLLTVDLSTTDMPRKTTFSPCLSNPPDVCYRIDHYVTTIELPANTNGYVLAVQRCCRIAGIINVSNSSNTGITYTTTIRGPGIGMPYFPNNSAEFAQKDTVVVCHNTFFTFDFSATDPDGDSLAYHFTDGIIGGDGSTNGAKPNPPSRFPYAAVVYNPGYDGAQPLGTNVTIDDHSGLISGTAPNTTGDYVVAVIADEYRNGVLVGSTRKEIHITVADCNLSAADLKPNYINCNDLSFTFSNESTATNITSYLWTFGDTLLPISSDTSHSPTPTHVYSDTGTYKLKLVVVASGGCEDSTTAIVKVYPGFKAGFTVNGSCILNPFQFTDATYFKYGPLSSWQWDFGETGITTDTSSVENPSYMYPTTGAKTVTLIVSSSKGCIDTSTYVVNVFDKPPLSLPFHDTLICNIDTLPLLAYGTGSFVWTPDNSTIRGVNTDDPIVFPKDTTVYHVQLNYMGCVSEDSITVNVLDQITVTLRPDTVVCKTDTFRLHPVSYALGYHWTASTGEVVAPVKYPLVQPLTNTTYYVTANLGKCTDNTSMQVYVYPYPTVTVGADTAICFDTPAQLHGTTTGDVFTWSPNSALLYYNTLTPIAAPSRTTTYILTVIDTVGCPKPVSDTTVVTVIPKVVVNAGRDTSVVVGQPLQLIAVSNTDMQSTSFAWTPTTGLDNPGIYNPITTLNANVDSITYIVTAKESHGCTGEDDIKVVVYKTQPDIFVPSGFTPNGDGRNDLLKPITVGITTLQYFNVYNRLGQLLYTTSEIGRGWDGNFAGTAQANGTYVYVTQGVDFTGKTVFRKGTVVLIR